jgi:hypothetical protein
MVPVKAITLRKSTTPCNLMLGFCSPFFNYRGRVKERRKRITESTEEGGRIQRFVAEEICCFLVLFGSLDAVCFTVSQCFAPLLEMRAGMSRMEQ